MSSGQCGEESELGTCVPVTLTEISLLNTVHSREIKLNECHDNKHVRY